MLHGATDQRVVIESGRPLSRSILWQLQRRYFDERGVRAWEQVPSYVTNNPVIAEAYATATVRYVQDLQRCGRLTPDRPVHVVELGAGTGAFGYYTLLAIERLRGELAVDIRIRYVMTDFTATNLDHLRRHRALQRFFAADLLALGRFDAESDDRIVFDDGTALEPGTQPLVVFANYVFDSIGHDLFFVNGGVLHEALATVRAAPGAITGDGAHLTIGALDDLAVDFAVSPLDHTEYYVDPRLNALIRHYAQAFPRSGFHIPVGALGCIEALRKLAGDRLLLLAADRGYHSLDEIADRDQAGLAFHGSFSVPVNFHAIGHWVEQAGGEWFQRRHRPGLRCEAFLFGDQLADCPELGHALTMHFGGFAPADYFNLHKFMRPQLGTCELPTLIAYFNLCKWDPRLFHGCVTRILDLLESADAATQRALGDGLSQVAEGFYFLPGTPDTPFELGSVYQRLYHFNEALQCYRQSELYFGASPTVAFNTGLCLAGLGRNDQALIRLREAAASAALAAEATAWIVRIEGERPPPSEHR